MIKWRLMSGCSTEPYNNKHDTGCSRVPAGLAVPSTTAPLHRDFKRGRHDSSLSDGFWPARQKTLPHPRLWPGLSANCASSGRDIPFTWDPEDTSAHQLLAAPKDILQVWCVPAIPVFNRNISLQRRNLSLCLGPSCFPWGTQPSTGPSPCSASKDKARQARPCQLSWFKDCFLSIPMKLLGSSCPVTDATNLGGIGLGFPKRATLGCNRRNQGEQCCLWGCCSMWPIPVAVKE